MMDKGAGLGSSTFTLMRNHTAMMNANAARDKRGKVSTLVETSYQEMRGILRNKFSSEKEIADVEQRLESFKKASEAARLEVLEADRGLAEQQNAVALAKSELLAIKTAMDQCAAELQGKSYHDPELGLSVDPKSYQESWS